MIRRYGKAMNEVGLGVRGTALSPDSDCNSNLPGSASFLSNTSSQDIDFIQDNSDYQWFLDYGYRDNQHTSILSLGDSYEATDLGYYDALAKNMDANLAEADMESFRTEDIHALLTNLPPMCTDHLSQENNRQGESFASVSGSMMAKFDFDSPHTSSQGEDSANSTTMSICKSELLFSPVKENPMLEANFSVDSLDCDLLNEHDIMLTCQANKDNYTIAFEGSVTMYSEDSDFHETDKSETSTEGCPTWARKLKMLNHRLDRSMTKSDSSSLTTWSKLKKRSSENQLRRLPSGNNNVSSNENSCNLNDATMKSQSMPNLYKNKLREWKKSTQSNFSNSTLDTCTVRRPVKVFDIQNQAQHASTNGGSDFSDMATSVDGSSSSNSENSKQQNFSLVKLFMKQKSMSAEGMSTALDHSSASENWLGTQSSDSNISEEKHPAIDHSSNTRDNIIVEDIEDDHRELETKDIPQISNNNNISERRDYKSRATNTKRNSSLGISISSESSNSSCTQSDNRKYNRLSKCVPLKLINKSMQTSVSELFKNPPYKLNTSVTKEQVKVVEASFLNKLKEKSEISKPVYILYPNYALPDLDFLNNKSDDIAKVLLMPQNIKRTEPKPRPFSCNDFETLKKKGFSHIQDWDSLNVLLPKEYKHILPDHFKGSKRNSTDISMDKGGSSSSSSTQPSSGFRGSSTILTDSQNSPATNYNPLFVYRYDSISSETSFNDKPAPPLPKRTISLDGATHGPPRPPLPRSILRKGLDNKRNKRYSMADLPTEESSDKTSKRLSLQEPYYYPRNKRLSETEDEGVDAGTSSSSFDEYEAPPVGPEPHFGNFSGDDLRQLEEFLKLSGFSMGESDNGDESMTQLKGYVGKFLSLRMNQDCKKVSFAKGPQKGSEGKFAPNNSPTVSAFLTQRQNQVKTLVDMPICEEGETSPETYSSPHSSPSHTRYDLCEKRSQILAVTDAVEQIIQHFSPATNQSQLNALGDSELNPACAKLTLTTLCPALYSALSDGLKPSLETSFGAIGNSVWQVVEASAQQGPLTKALNELVMRINGEDGVTEGLVKFNMFVFGLLNVRSLDAWMSYLRTRESIIKKHYEVNSLMVLGLTGSSMIRGLLDTLVEALQPLALLPFQFDLLFEYRQLHESLKRMESYSSIPDEIPLQNLAKPKVRPRSCIDPKPTFKLQEDVTSVAKKRWSGVSLTSKLFQAYNRLAVDSEEEYTDSLETHQHPVEEDPPQVENLPQDGPESLDSNLSDEKPLNGKKFKRLQKKWEMLSGKETSEEKSPSPESPVKSKIPRPVISPVKPSGIPLLKSPTSRLQKPAVGGTVKKSVSNLVKGSPAKKGVNTTTTRTSRVDQIENTQRAIPRPSSLPYKPATQGAKNSKVTPQRRAVSTSVTRKATNQTPKVVKTLSHRLPSESGHLSYNEGERLRVVLEVDDQWLLCCRGTQKGLVPRSAVIPDTGRF